MGRKLTGLEAPSFELSHTETALGQHPTSPSRIQILQQRIAQQLSISPDEFRKAPIQSNAAQGQGASGAAFDLALSRDCSEMLEAYVRISDPERRLQFLKVVREAAALSVDSDPAAERD